MSAFVGVATDGVRIPISRERVADVARAVLRSERASHVMLSITFVTTGAIRSMNRVHLRRNRPTDVIAFGFRAANGRSPIVGDVYIAPDVARASARANQLPVREELVRLVVHGTLHVLGYDHAEGANRMRSPMWKKQERLVRRLSAEKP